MTGVQTCALPILAHSRFAARRGLGVLLACALPVGALVACGQDLAGTSSSSARDALYFNDRASGLPPVYLQEPYTTPIEVAGGAGPYTVRRIEGTLPPGLTLSGTTLSGTPTKAGTYTFTLEVTDSTLSSKQKSYTLNVQELPPLSLSLTLPGGEIRGETRVPLLITAPRSVRAARVTWTLPEKVTVTRVQPEGGALVFWRQDGTRLTVDLGFKAVPRSGSRVALISVKPAAPVMLSSPDLGYEARGGDGKALAQKLTAAEQKAADAQKAAEQKKADEQKAADQKAAEIRANEAGLTRQKDDLAKAEKDLAAKKDEVAKLTAEANRLRQEAFLITRQFTMEKATRDQVRSEYEGALERNHDNAEAAEVQGALRTVKAQNNLVDGLDLDKQKADAKVAAAEAQLRAVTGQHDELARSIKRLQGTIDLVAKRLKQLKDPLVQGVVNAPVIEFAAPTIKVEQIETPTHHVDVNFATVPRVDRCMTCHKAIDRKDATEDETNWRKKNKIEAIKWSELPQPLKSHPNLDLFVGDNSPHPAGKFGCTACHWGWDRETDFSRAGHTPNHEEKAAFVQKDGVWTQLPEDEDPPKGVKPVEMTQRQAWERNHGWYEEEFNTQPMREKKFVQAGCLKCHTEQTNLKGGEKLDHGRRLVEQLGCWSCHKMKQLETYTTHKIAVGEDFEGICKAYDVDPADVTKLNPTVTIKVGAELQIPIRTLRKVGPNLAKIAGKTNKDWTRKWLENPVEFHPNTYMPRFWGLDNNIDTPERNATEINAVSEFLFAVSEQAQYPTPPVTGDVERGKELVANAGCMGCHVINDKLTDMKVPAKLTKFMDNDQYRRFRSQGPQLGGEGSKTDRNWLYAWVKNPKQYHPKTKMPNLRLSDQEAADVAEYLVSLRHEATDKKELPAIKSHVLDDLTLEYLEITLPRASAEQKLTKLDDLIESYFVDEATSAYYTDATRLARDEAKLATLRKKADEEFDEDAGRAADKLENPDGQRLSLDGDEIELAAVCEDARPRFRTGPETD